MGRAASGSRSGWRCRAAPSPCGGAGSRPRRHSPALTQGRSRSRSQCRGHWRRPQLKERGFASVRRASSCDATLPSTERRYQSALVCTHCTSWHQSFCSGQPRRSCPPHWRSGFSSTFCSGKRNRTNLEHLLTGKWTKLQGDSLVCLQKSRCSGTHQGSTRAGCRRPYGPGWWWCPGSDRIGTKTKKEHHRSVFLFFYCR